MKENWTPNMWHSNQPISNIATGKMAKETIRKKILSLKETGQETINEFIAKYTLREGTTTGKSYYAPINKQAVNLFKEVNTKKKHSIPEDEGQSFADILSIFDNKSLDLRKVMEWSITSKPWSICKEENKSRTNQKSLFRDNLELLLPTSSTTTLPQGIHVSVDLIGQYLCRI